MTTKAAVFKNCFVCDYQAVTEATECPQCDKPLRSALAIRMRGGAIAFLGFLLIGIMTWVVNEFGNASRIEGVQTASSDNMLYMLLLGVFVLGGIAVLTGVWLLVTGRRNLKLLWLLIASGVALSVIVVVFVVLG